MAENKKSFIVIKENYDILYNINYSFNDDYGLSFLTPERHARVSEALSALRRLRELEGHQYHVLCKIFRHQVDNYYKVKDLISQEPRTHAQKFIGKKNIREFIFERDNWRCLCCGSVENLSIDHIVPIHIGGLNRLYNLQTLCKGCNSRKSTQIIDYR